MITLTMKQAETVRNLLAGNKKATTWIDKKIAKAVTPVATKKTVKTTKRVK